MNLLQDSTHTMRGLNARLKGFLEQVSKLQEDNQRMEAQIVNWGTSRSHDWSQQEEAVSQLRAQVGKLLMENAQLALQSDTMKSRAAAIQARCEMEERNTRCLEQQVDLLRHSKKKTEQSSMKLQANIRHSAAELQEMKQKFEVTEHTLRVRYHIILTKILDVSRNTENSVRKLSQRAFVLQRSVEELKSSKHQQ
ncbi:unnamed protein product [Tetraodon nigroviridis]|uniref:(spotted green pufferfish) hypothetical protein n=1 Tax=Tetraodon nigroviridis TaxID=99883 RepID=Q4RZM8_TETNG|nr:unnamed protein product [Tetraodon nigroviridis]